MQKINLIAQGVLELSHRENLHDNNDDDTHQGWIIVRDGMYSVADKKKHDVIMLITYSRIIHRWLKQRKKEMDINKIY